MAIRGILFDKDGTLLDYWRTWVPINRQAALAVAAGNETLAGELLRLGGHDPITDKIEPGAPLAAGDFQDIARAFGAHPEAPPVTEIVPVIERVFLKGGAVHSELIEGALQTLIELKRRGFRVGIATNDSAGGLEASLAKHGVLPLLDFAAGCDSGYGTKPHPGMVRGFCEAVGIVPGEVAVVGDATHDLAMGRAAHAGLMIGVLSGTSAREDIEDFAHLVVDSVNDLLSLPEFQR